VPTDSFRRFQLGKLLKVNGSPSNLFGPMFFHHEVPGQNQVPLNQKSLCRVMAMDVSTIKAATVMLARRVDHGSAPVKR
jgi:hypothetical protein